MSDNILYHHGPYYCSSLLFFFSSFLSEQGFFQNRKPSEAKNTVGEPEAEGDPGSHRRSHRVGHHHRPGCHIFL